MQNQFTRTELLFGREAMDKLSRCRVAVFGVGGVGGFTVEALARSGVGAIDIIDNDKVALSNINRQIIATHKTVGKYKVDACAERIAEINPDCTVTAHRTFYMPETQGEFDFTKYDYIVDAIDLVSCKVDLIVTARERGIPIVSALGTGNKLDAQRLRLCDIAETSGCPFARVVRRELRRRGVEHHAVVFSPEEALPARQLEAPPPGRRSVPGSAVWVPATAGLLLAQYVVTELIK